MKKLDHKNTIPRYTFIGLAMVALVLVIIGKALYTMTAQRDYWMKVSDQQKRDSVPLPQTRGNIFSCDGQLMASSLPEYKVYKNDITVEWLGAIWTHDEFSKAWTAIYEAFGADITIIMIEDYTRSPHSEEWIRVGGPQHFADCWFQQHWYDANDMRDAYHCYTIGEGWYAPEGWR